MNQCEVNQHQYKLIARLDNARQQTLVIVARIHPDQLIYPDWRMKDILAHLTAWEKEAVKSLLAYQNGGEYTLTDYASDHEYNAEVFRQHYDLPFEQIYEHWMAARDNLKTAIRKLPPNQFKGKFLLPWGARASIVMMVRDMTVHEKNHAAEIAKVKRN